MTLLQAAIIFAISLMNRTYNFPYDKQIVEYIASAVVEITADPSEVETLIKIARYESGGFHKEVGNCQKRGDDGFALGLFQVHPRSRQEAKELCGTAQQQAAIALDRVRESIRMCRKFGLQGGDLLGGYTTGSCVRNNAAGRLRWGDGKTIVWLMDSGNE